jgi:hypothetical protein
MQWFDIPTDPAPKVLRQFAGAWLVFFLAFAAHQGIARGHHLLAGVIAVAAVIVGATGLIWPAAIRWLFVGWMMLAFPIGWLVSQVMLLVMFYFLLTPVALFFRIIGRDALRRKAAAGESSYWRVKESPQSIRNYFRQY